MSDVVERVARAIRGAHKSLDGTLPWEELDDSTRQHWLKIGHAAIAAMREPSDAMCLSAKYTKEPYKDAPDAMMVREIGKRHAHLVYRAMIDEALK